MAEYIEREAVHKLIVGLRRYQWDSPVSSERCVTVSADDVYFGVDEIPAADVAPVVHGAWLNVRCEGPAGPWSGTCSRCNMRNDIPHPTIAHYCPSCGAKMDKEAEP